MSKNIIPLTIMFFVVVCGMLGSITYFRGDDFISLHIGAKYKYDVFTLLFKTYMGGYRPITWLAMLLEYKLFKLNSTGYQFFISLVFAIAMLYFYKLTKIIRGTIAGFIAFLCFFFYYPVLSAIWWRANINFALYLVCYGMALFYSIEGLRSSKIRHYVLAVVASILTLLNYEFALMIIPIVFMYAFLYRREIKNKLRGIGFMFILFLSILIVFLVSQSFVEKNIILERVRISFGQMLYNLDYWLRNSVNWFSYCLLLLAGIGLCRKLYSRIAVFLYGSIVYLIFKESSYIIYIFTIFIIRFLFGANNERFAIVMAIVGMLFVSTLAIPGYLIGMIRYPLFFWYGIAIFLALGLANLVKQLANNFGEKMKYKIVFQYVIIIPLFVIGIVQTVKNDFKLGRSELFFLRDKTITNKEVAFYLKETIETDTRIVYLWEEFDYDFILNYYNPNPNISIDVLPTLISWDSLWDDVDKTYIVANTVRIAKLFPELYNKDTYLDGIFNVYFGENVKGNAVVLPNKGLEMVKFDENAVFCGASENKPVSATYLISSDTSQMWITIITYPRLVYPYLEDSFCKILYSLNGEKWFPVTYFGGKGLFNWWIPIWGNEIREPFFVPNNKVYIKIILQNGQLWSSMVWPSCIIINDKPNMIFQDILLKNTVVEIKRTSENGQDIVFSVKVVKELHKDLYGISILEVSRIEK